jgi:hypothetical protein
MHHTLELNRIDRILNLVWEAYILDAESTNRCEVHVQLTGLSRLLYGEIVGYDFA